MERWQQQNDNSWAEEDSWDTKKDDWSANKKDDGWKGAREWDENEAKSNSWEESKEDQKPVSHWAKAEPKKESPPQPPTSSWGGAQEAKSPNEPKGASSEQLADCERKERLAKIFKQSVNVSEPENVNETNLFFVFTCTV